MGGLGWSLRGAAIATVLSAACYGAVPVEHDRLDGGTDGDLDSDSDSGSDADVDVEADIDPDDEEPPPVDGDADDWRHVEWCDGFDNDDDGLVDEERPCPPCSCYPGAWRRCDTPAYDAIGIQWCRVDGQDWSPCEEQPAPRVCTDHWFSAACELALISTGECVVDMWDLDNDGDSWESLGDCTGIVCNWGEG